MIIEKAQVNPLVPMKVELSMFEKRSLETLRLFNVMGSVKTSGLCFYIIL